jgi:tRNA pseudouridine55 synthase
MYKYAREGISVKKDARKINIYELKNIDIKLPKVIFDISCSKGTYIRSIARDLGLNLGCGAHLSRPCSNRSASIFIGRFLLD